MNTTDSSKKSSASPAAVAAPLTAEMADQMLRRDAGIGHPDSHFSKEESRAIRAIASGAHIVVAAQPARAEQVVRCPACDQADPIYYCEHCGERWVIPEQQAARAVPPASVEKVREALTLAQEKLRLYYERDQEYTGGPLYQDVQRKLADALALLNAQGEEAK